MLEDEAATNPVEGFLRRRSNSEVRTLLRIAFALLATAGAFQQAHAQQSPAGDGWSLTLGTGGLYAPAYEGDDDYRLSLLPNVQVSYGDRFFASVQDGIGYSWIMTPTIQGGALMRIKFSRSDDGDQAFAVTGANTTDLRGLGDVDTSVELGGFLNYEIGSLRLSTELRQAVSGHEGLVADFGARWSGRSLTMGQPVLWSVGPRLRIVDGSYNKAYFGVDPSQSAASGLPVYNAAGGAQSAGVGATAIFPLTRDNAWAAVVIAGYDRLIGDAGDSPLVQERGSQDQATLGVFLSYRWR